MNKNQQKSQEDLKKDVKIPDDGAITQPSRRLSRRTPETRRPPPPPKPPETPSEKPSETPIEIDTNRITTILSTTNTFSSLISLEIDDIILLKNMLEGLNLQSDTDDIFTDSDLDTFVHIENVNTYEKLINVDHEVLKRLYNLMVEQEEILTNIEPFSNYSTECGLIKYIYILISVLIVINYKKVIRFFKKLFKI